MHSQRIVKTAKLSSHVIYTIWHVILYSNNESYYRYRDDSRTICKPFNCTCGLLHKLFML